MDFPFGETITLIHRVITGRDAQGNYVFDETSTENVSGACSPDLGTEGTSGMDQVSSKPLAYLPAGTVVASTDALIVRSLKYEVDGSATAWNSPFTGWAAGVVVPLKRVTG